MTAGHVGGTALSRTSPTGGIPVANVSYDVAPFSEPDTPHVYQPGNPTVPDPRRWGTQSRRPFSRILTYKFTPWRMAWSGVRTIILGPNPTNADRLMQSTPGDFRQTSFVLQRPTNREGAPSSNCRTPFVGTPAYAAGPGNVSAAPVAQPSGTGILSSPSRWGATAAEGDPGPMPGETARPCSCQH